MQTALVIGFGGKSGVSAVNFLLKKGYKVKANDIKKRFDLEMYIEQISDADKVEFCLGSHDKDILKDVALVVISPGVPSDIDIIKEAKKADIPVLSEVELSFQHYSKNWICITGTDGKSTTTSLIGEILKLKYHTLVGGNLGIPLTELILDAKNDTYVVAELSSFQLENIKDLKPFVSVLINIAKDHLDRYSSFYEYIKAKMRLFDNQTEEDFSVFNFSNEILSKWLDKIYIRSRKYFFSLFEKVDSGACFKDDYFIWNDNNESEKIFKDGEQYIKGEHNKENILAAITVAKILNIENEYIQEGIKNFKGLPHRMEFVREINNRTFYNDSKATTTSAVYKSLAGFDNIILIMGGRDKGLDYSELNDVLNRKVKRLILIGEAKEKIKNMINYEDSRILEINEFNQAIKRAYEISEEGDNIILSPACTSYDMFKNFEIRGDTFKKIVNDL